MQRFANSTSLLAWLSLCGVWGPSCFAQEPAADQPAAAGTAAASPPAEAAPAVIVRDPVTGRLYRQQWVSVNVPTVQWESKPVTQTVYEPRVSTQLVPTQQTVYTPTTQYVMQPRLKGVWNPFRQPVMSYEYRPVTTWTPQQQTISTPVTTQQWVPRQQTVYVPQPVQKTQTQQQLVQTEIPQPTPPTSVANYAIQRPPLVRIPLLAQQRLLPWQPAYAASGLSSPAVPANVGGLRPIAASNAVAGIQSSTYAAPLHTATANSGSMTRDALQTGMSATVLR